MYPHGGTIFFLIFKKSEKIAKFWRELSMWLFEQTSMQLNFLVITAFRRQKSVWHSNNVYFILYCIIIYVITRKINRTTFEYRRWYPGCWPSYILLSLQVTPKIYLLQVRSSAALALPIISKYLLNKKRTTKKSCTFLVWKTKIA